MRIKDQTKFLFSGQLPQATRFFKFSRQPCKPRLRFSCFVNWIRWQNRFGDLHAAADLFCLPGRTWILFNIAVRAIWRQVCKLLLHISIRISNNLIHVILTCVFGSFDTAREVTWVTCHRHFACWTQEARSLFGIRILASWITFLFIDWADLNIIQYWSACNLSATRFANCSGTLTLGFGILQFGIRIRLRLGSCSASIHGLESCSAWVIQFLVKP